MTNEPELEIAPEDVFGGCPECGKMTSYMNVGRNHWGFCEEHRFAWWIGSNLFSDWRRETDETWEENKTFLSGFRVFDLKKKGPEPESRASGGGCAVCNPSPRTSQEELAQEIQDSFSARLHVIRFARDDYGLIEIPGSNGTAAEVWGSSFVSERAARMFRDDLVAAAAEGNVKDAICSSGVTNHFNLVDRLLRIIETHGGDRVALAEALANRCKWNIDPSPSLEEVEHELPF